MKRYAKEPSVNRCSEKQEETKHFCNPENTKPISFSFEKRDQFVQKNKEKMKKKLSENEKKHENLMHVLFQRIY